MHKARSVDLLLTVEEARLDDDFDRRARATTILEVIHWASGNLESAIRGIGDSMERLTQLGNHVMMVASAFAVADLLVGLGRLSEADLAHIPGEAGWPLVGNTFTMLADPHAFATRMIATHGKVYRNRAFGE